MFPETMNTADIKKVSELWEEEKKYRWWIIGFAVALITLFSLNLTLLIVAYVFQADLINYFTNYFNSVTTGGSGINIKQLAESQFNQVAMTLVGMCIGFLLSNIAFIYSIYNCYKAKSFEKLDYFSSFFLGFQTIFSLFSLFQLIQNSTIYGGNTFMILYLVLPFLTIPVWLLLSRQIKKIKRLFFIAKRQEEITAFYEANKDQMAQMGMDPNMMNNPYQAGPFGFPFQQRRQNPIPQAAVGEETPEVKPQDNTKFSKLQLMTTNQLRKIADKLSISGNADMKKPELIKTILSVSQSLEVENNSDKNEIDIDLGDNPNTGNKTHETTME